MEKQEEQLVIDYMIHKHQLGSIDVFDAVDCFLQMNGDDIISMIINYQGSIRPIVTCDIPQFSNERDVNNVLRVLIDSGLDNLTYEQIGGYLCPVDVKFEARRKYGETHYKFATQLGLTAEGRPLSATEIGVAYYLLENDEKRQELMKRLIFSIPFVQHAILKAKDGVFYMPNFLAVYLAPSTAVRRRSNMHKIMSWANDITMGGYKQLFDNIVWY